MKKTPLYKIMSGLFSKHGSTENSLSESVHGLSSSSNSGESLISSKSRVALENSKSILDDLNKPQPASGEEFDGWEESDFPREKRKTSKLMDYFGVKAGEKERTVITNLTREKRQARSKKVSNGDQTFLARIYFANFTYTSIQFPLKTTAERGLLPIFIVAIAQIVKRFNIKDEITLYAIHEYQQNTGCKLSFNES